MYIDLDCLAFDTKINCIFNQAKVRNILLSKGKNGNGIIRNGIYIIKPHCYFLDLLLEGRKTNMSMSYEEHSAHILNVKIFILKSFQYGLNNRYYIWNDLNISSSHLWYSDCRFVFRLAKTYSSKCVD